MTFHMWCRKCGCEVDRCEKVRGLLPGGRKHLWWNKCGKCGCLYAAPPPIKARVEARSYVRASHQLPLF